MDGQKSKTVKMILVCAIVLAVAAGVFVLVSAPDERFEEKVDVADVNSYDPEEVNGFLFWEATESSVRVRGYLEEGRLSDLWNAVEGEKDVNLLIVYNIPKSQFVWTEVSRKMPKGARHPYPPSLIQFTNDALEKGACVANITDVQGDIAICVGVNKETAINVVKDYAREGMKCKGVADCAVRAVDDAIKRDADTTVILYVGENGKVLRIYEPRRNVTVVWYGGELIEKGGIQYGN